LKIEGSMATISIASDKGGPGKTTTAILIGADLALDGYRTCIIDTDVNQQAAAFGAKADIPGLTVIGDVDETKILSALRAAERDAEIVIIDLPGGSSTLALKALHRSHFVLVPSQASMPDVKAAMKTFAQIDDAQELARSPISRALVWTRLMSGFESVPVRKVREAVETDPSVRIFKTALMERAAYRDIHISGMVPRQKAPNGAPAANVTALTAELLRSIAKLQEVSA
jgi:chromosome partitioning protein